MLINFAFQTILNDWKVNVNNFVSFVFDCAKLLTRGVVEGDFVMFLFFFLKMNAKLFFR